MRTVLPIAAIALLGGCGAPESGTIAKTTEGEGARMKMSMAVSASTGSGSMLCYESTSVDRIPDIALDRSFTYLVRYIPAREDPRVLLSTLIPHKAGMTYRLVDEAPLHDSVWQVTFQAYDDGVIAAGLFVHTNLRVPWAVSGRRITEVEVVVLDQHGNSIAEEGGVPGEPKSKKPQRRRMQDVPDEDPATPPKEPVTIYTNGNLVEGRQYALGYAQVNGAASGLILTNDATTSSVTFANTTGGTVMDFLHFDQDVTDLGANPAICTFIDGDGHTGTDPRPNVLRP